MKIQNLSSLIFCSESDDKTTLSNKTKRRETWCPGPFQKKSTDEVSNLEIDILEPVEEDPYISLLHPFSKVVQESEAPVDSIPSRILLPDLAENTYKKEDFSLPDAHALLNVTSRRKNHKKRSSRPLEGQLEEKLSEFDELCLENDTKMYKDTKVKESKTVRSESESAPANKCDDSSIGHLTEGVSVGHNNLTVRETNAILVIKQLEKQVINPMSIEALEVEKTSVQANLDSIVTLATEHNASLWGKCDKEINGDATSVIYTAVEWIASDFDLLWNAFDNVLSVTEEVFQFLSMLSESLLSFMILPRQCMLQLKSIVLGHESINNFMGKKFKEVELEKNLLSNQLHEHQMQICELKTGFEKREKEQGLQHDMEMDELLSQVLYLQKEVSQLSSSSLARENEALRKEHDKKKIKLKDTECKLKNIIHEKVKLEGEKAQAECKIKSLQDQCAILERDILKRDSHFDKIRESRSDINKAKVVHAIAQQSFQVDYQRLEFTALDLEAENASLKDALEIAFQEKEEALVKNEIIESELEAMAKKLNTAHFDMKLLAEDLLRMEQRAADFEASSRRLEDSLNLLSREKEEMILQLTEALLEVEAEKSQWAFKEKIQSEKLKISNDETVKLSENLLKMQEELELCKGQRNGFRESLKHSEENAKREKDSSIAKSLEINRLRDELNRFRVDVDGNEVSRPDLELTFTQYLPANAEVQNLSTPLKVTREREVLLSKVEHLRRLEGDIDVFKWKYDDLQSNAEIFFQEFNQRISIFEVKILEEASLSNKQISELSMKLSSTEEKLRAYRLRFKEVVNERKLMDRKYQEASTMLKDKLRTYGQYVLDLTKRLAEKD